MKKQFLLMVIAGFLPVAGRCDDSGQDFSGGLTDLGQGRYSRAAADDAVTTTAMPPTPGRLGVGDTVKLTVFGEDDLSGSFVVDDSGAIALPLVGQVQASGLTARQLQARLTHALANGYLKNPRVTVDATGLRPFYILGEVNRPGGYPATGNLSVLAAVALAGGYTPRARTGHVTIRRASDPRHADVRVDDTTRVYSGDVVQVKERFF